MWRLSVLLLSLLVPILWAAEVSELLRGRQVVFVERSENWHTAYEKCRAKGMQLLTLNTKEEFKDMVTLAKKHGPMPGFWIAATDLGHEGQFIYDTNGQPVLDSWGPEEPDNGANQREEEHCVELTERFGFFALNDNVCRASLPYWCESVPTGDLPKEQGKEIPAGAPVFCTSVYRCG